jgi:N-acetylmuramoyl-L-alanine amidase
MGIWVLQATAMPSVLVETGYITNREEEDYLNSEKGQDEISDCIVNALRGYITWLEKPQAGTATGRSGAGFDPQKSYAFLRNIEEQEKKRLLPSNK